MVEVYSEPYKRRHYASRLSAAYCFRLASHIFVIILTIILATSSESLWVREATFREQPNVHFLYDVLLLLEGPSAGSERVWSTFPSVTAPAHAKLAAVDIQAIETDTNHDGKLDVIDVSVRVATGGPVHSVKALLGFRYTLEDKIKLQMQCLAFLQHSSPLPGAQLSLDGELRLHQRQPLSFDAVRTVYDTPALDPGKGTAMVRGLDQIQLASILRAYHSRNETTLYEAPSPLWHAGSGTDYFTLDARIRVPPAESIAYSPGVFDVLKVAWPQVLSLYLVLYSILSSVFYVSFHFRLLRTRVVSDLPNKSHVW